MIATACLFTFVIAAAIADWRAAIIPNRIVYSGIVLALAGNIVASLAGWSVEISPGDDRWGWIGIGESLLGLFACGGVMVICFVLFAGQVGGGDVKLLALIGAWWGVFRGLEAMLWTLVLGAAAALITLVWRMGAIEFVVQVGRSLKAAWRSQGTVLVDQRERQLLRTPLRLAPAAAIAVVVVHLRIAEWL